MNTLIYEKPREKLARKGAKSLTNAELLQVVIGSGNAQVSVSKIAKKVASVLAKSGSTVHPQELLAIQGVGKVKAGQILALFELAARFPVLSGGEVFSTNQSLKSLYSELSTVQKQTLMYVTFDGARRVISKRQVLLTDKVPVAKQVQKVYADCLTDMAVSVLVAIGCEKQALNPGLIELNFVRDVHKTSQLLAIPVRQFVLVSQQGENVLKESAL